jgi:hypothetical protein
MFALPILIIGFIFVQCEDFTFYLNKTTSPTIPDDCIIYVPFYNEETDSNYYDYVPCSDIDYVMINVVNVTDKNTTVYIDSGIYDCYDYRYNSFSLSLSLIGDISSSSSSVDADDISTYPVLLFNFLCIEYVIFYGHGVSSNFYFEHIKFLIGNKTTYIYSFIRSFILFCFVLTCVIDVDSGITSIKNCIFSREEGCYAHIIYYVVCENSKFSIENSF